MMMCRSGCCLVFAMVQVNLNGLNGFYKVDLNSGGVDDI